LPTHLEFVRRVIVDARPDVVFAYVADFRLAPQWRGEVLAATAEPDAPVRLGSRLHEVARIAGRRVVTDSVVDGYDAGRHFSFAHVAGPMPVAGEYLVEQAPSGSRLSYTLRAELHGLWRLAAPVLRRTGGGTIDRSLTTLAHRIETRSGGVDPAQTEAD
jgi:hypothetical protein